MIAECNKNVSHVLTFKPTDNIYLFELNTSNFDVHPVNESQFVLLISAFTGNSSEKSAYFQMNSDVLYENHVPFMVSTNCVKGNKGNYPRIRSPITAVKVSWLTMSRNDPGYGFDTLNVVDIHKFKRSSPFMDMNQDGTLKAFLDYFHLTNQDFPAQGIESIDPT